MVTVRRYHPDQDAEALWQCKQSFELGLGEEGDAETEAAYRSKLTDQYRERYLDWVRRCVDTESGCVRVATDNDKIVGYVFVLPETHAMIWDAAVINEVYVEPDHRGTGVADSLLETALEHARQQNLPYDRIALDVHPENERAQAFYRRFGFEQWGELLARSL